MNFSVLRPRSGAKPAWDPPGSAYDVHQFVWNLFDDPDLDRRNFLYRLDADPRPVLYLVSDRSPVTVPDGWGLHTTPYDPQPEEDEVLAFRLRANATVSRSNPAHGKAAGRHSVVADALRGHDGAWREAMLGAYESWMRRKGEHHGFELLDRFEVADHKKVTARHKREGRQLRFDQGDLHGLLRVTEPVALRRALLEGVGRSRAFGCGLLMVRRP